MRIDVVFDAVCPWCFIGKRRLESALAMRPDIRVEPRWRPFLLNPELPPEGIDRTAYLIKKFGSESRVRRIYGAIADAGLSVEIDFEFDRISHTPSTVDAHRLVRFADAAGMAEAAVEALFQAYFVSGRNIGSMEELMDIGEIVGLGGGTLRDYLASDEDVALIHEENSRAHGLGINGVPSFVFNGSMVISGAQEPPVLARMLDAACASDTAA